LLFIFSYLYLSRPFTWSCQINSQSCPDPIQAIITKHTDSPKVLISRQLRRDLEYFLPGHHIDQTTSLFKHIDVIIVTPQDAKSIQAHLISRSAQQLLDLGPASDVLGRHRHLTDFVESQVSQSVYLDSTGHLSPRFDEADSNTNIIINSMESDYLVKVYDLLDRLVRFLGPADYIYYQDAFWVQATGEPLIVVSSIKPLSDTISLLSHLSSLKKTKQNPQLVDLRYENPILK
jgi:hypothetical protein